MKPRASLVRTASYLSSAACILPTVLDARLLGELLQSTVENGISIPHLGRLDRDAYPSQGAVTG
jgi:hypothetical protein